MLSANLAAVRHRSFASMDCAGNVRLHAKINFLDLFIAFKVGRLALDGDATRLQNVSIVGDAERKRDRLLGEQQGEPIAMKLEQGVVKLFDYRGREAETRFIQH